jgi:hypothetical protein
MFRHETRFHFESQTHAIPPGIFSWSVGWLLWGIGSWKTLSILFPRRADLITNLVVAAARGMGK